MTPRFLTPALVALACMCLAGAAEVARAEAPLFSGNTDVARRIRSGKANVLLMGDSLQNLQQGEYLKRWPVQKTTGQFVGPNVGEGTGAYNWSNFPGDYLRQTQARFPDDPALLDGFTGYAPLAGHHVTFNAVAAGPDDNLVSNRVYEMNLFPDQENYFKNGAWANKSTGKMNMDLLVYANPNGVASGLKFDVRGNSLNVPLASTPISTYAAAPQLRKYTLSFDAQKWDAGKTLSSEVRLIAGATPPQNSNAIFLGTRFYTGEDGFQITNAAMGGKATKYYLDPKNTSDANLQSFVNLTDTNLAMIWIGANDTGLIDKAEYKARMQQMVGRYKTAKPDMQFALISTYDLGHARYAEFTEALHEIAETDPSVLFLNMYRASGPFSELDAKYLSDHVHPSAEGAKYMADTLWGLIDTAASSNAPVPEPSAALTVLTLCGVASLRRSRGR